MSHPGWYLLLNPAAGGGRGAKLRREVEQQLHRAGLDHTLYVTRVPGDAIQAVRSALHAGYRKIIVAGGDGTLNEAANGILGQAAISPQAVSLGLIPVGTGNDWRRTWKIPAGIKESVEILKKGNSVLQDAGKISCFKDGKPYHSWFVNIAGCGFDARVAYAANEAKKKGKSGLLTYIGQLVGTMYSYRAQKATIETDGQKQEVDLFALLAGIGKYGGNNMKLVPDADPADGWLDVTLVRNIARLKVVMNLGGLFSGRFVRLPEVQQIRCRQVRIETGEQMLFQADGESVGHAPVGITLVPAALRVIVP